MWPKSVYPNQQKHLCCRIPICEKYVVHCCYTLNKEIMRPNHKSIQLCPSLDSILKLVYSSCIKKLLLSEKGSQPVTHTGTQRLPAKLLGSFYTSILSTSQSRQGAAGGREARWIKEVDRLHACRRKLLLLVCREVETERLQQNGQADYSVGMWSHFSCHLSLLPLHLPARRVWPIYCSRVLQRNMPHPVKSIKFKCKSSKKYPRDGVKSVNTKC